MKKQRKIYTFLLSLLLAFSLLLPGSIVPVEAAGGDMAVHFIDDRAGTGDPRAVGRRKSSL